LAPVVNFTNILQAAFLYESFLPSFFMFWQNDLGAKAAHKMLMKLTPGTTY